MKIYLDTVGCRLNQAEIEQYARQFHAAGHSLVGSPAEADMVVINTCAVTAAAASDSRQKARQAAAAHGAARIVLTGCWSTLEPKQAAALPGVSTVIANNTKDSLVADLLGLAPETFDLEPLLRQPIPGARMRTRAFIKAQDGCDNFCTFCVTRLARGRARSRSLSEVLTDIRATLLEGQGDIPAAKEIVLTGVQLSSWGQDIAPGLHLKDLIQAILDETDTPRLRLSSLEPWDLDESFFALWHNPRLCRHLHLPLQSGCTATLKRMGRKVTPDSFAGLVRAARSIIPGVAITTDLIAGFPGENEREFAESLDFVNAMQFADGHVFTYSDRSGAPSTRLPGSVEPRLRKTRSSQLRQHLVAAAQAYQDNFVGETLPVLWESATVLDAQGWLLSGLTDNYLRVSARAPHRLWNQITPVQLTGRTGSILQGQLQQCPTDRPQGSISGFGL
jgi:threonylcarbamoyladenosine tRNA methylthiotransferase MtaB